MKRQTVTINGNEAAARIAHRLNEVIAIYPITPASPIQLHCMCQRGTSQNEHQNGDFDG